MSSPNKHERIGFFYHFPKNFLRPYGPAEDVPTEETVFKRTNIKNCEWLVRPHYAVSESSSTLSGNMPILSGHKLLRKSGSFTAALPSLQALATNLGPFNLQGEGSPTRANANAVLKALVQDASLDAFCEEAFTIGGALMTLATNYLLARSYLRNPEVCASSISMPSGEADSFKQSGSLADLRTLMLAGKHKGRPAPATQADPSDLLRCLDDSDDEGNTLHNRQRRRRRLLEDIEDSPPPAHKVKRSEKTKKIKDATKGKKSSQRKNKTQK